MSNSIVSEFAIQARNDLWERHPPLREHYLISEFDAAECLATRALDPNASTFINCLDTGYHYVIIDSAQPHKRRVVDLAATTCTCQGSSRRNRDMLMPCYHILAINIWTRAQALMQAHAADLERWEAQAAPTDEEAEPNLVWSTINTFECSLANGDIVDLYDNDESEEAA